jgi:hypothetical protein
MSVFVTPPSSMRAATAPQNSADPQGASAATPAPSHDDIARRAYEIYVKRGRQQGQCKQNWRQAEQDLHHEGLATCAAPACGWGQAPAPSSGPVAPTVAASRPASAGDKGSTCCGPSLGTQAGCHTQASHSSRLTP